MNEKLAIARGSSWCRSSSRRTASTPSEITFDDEAHQARIIEGYTREAGVRNLEREIGADLPQARAPGGAGEGEGADVGPVDAEHGRRAPRQAASSARAASSRSPEIGVATGLAWTEVGGELLETEVGLMKGKGKLILTGKLGEVMQESARAAVSYLRSRADVLGIDPDFNEQLDIHIHVPEGAIPKDGPSAGITMATALVSALTEMPVRKDIAMTGEITLRGKVLPVGGIKDKVLAAFRAGITEMILPQENEKDLEDIPAEVRGVMEVHLVESMDEVLRLALDRPRCRAAGQGRPTVARRLRAEPPAGPGS